MSLNISTVSSEFDDYDFGNDSTSPSSAGIAPFKNSLETTPEVISALETWGYGFLFVTVINMSSVMGILFFPLMKTSLYTVVMRAMIGLAIGTLSGSSLFHLIPKAFGLPDESRADYLPVASFVWLAVWIAMLLECVIKIGVKSRAKSRRMRQEKLMNGDIVKENNNPSRKSIQLDEFDMPNGHMIGLDSSKLDDNDFERLPERNGQIHNLPVYHSTFSLNRKVLEAVNLSEPEEGKEIKSVAWIVIIGDSLHNFIDGVSIGAGFTNSFQSGFTIALAVILEEFPHELGDFAILVNSGLSVKKALFFNFMSALTCYLGLCLGILLGKIDWENYIFAFAAGIFIYVSVGDMIPEVTSLIDEVSEIAPRKAWKVLLIHNIGILAGVIIMLVLAWQMDS